MSTDEKTRTDTEVLCEFMEKRPTNCDGFGWFYSGDENGANHDVRVSPLRWWEADAYEKEIVPIDLTLDRLREVEERLTEEQRKDYMATLFVGHTPLTKDGLWKLCHASAEQKIRALAEVLRQTR